MPEAPTFQTAQEHDQQTSIPEISEPDHPDIEDLTDLGTPFASEDLPDQGVYKEVFVEFPACMPFASFGETITDTGFNRSEKKISL